MARVTFVVGSTHRVGNLRLLRADTPFNTSLMRSVAMTTPSDDLRRVFLADRSEAVPKKDNVAVRGTAEKSQPKAATDTWAFEHSTSCQSRTRQRDCYESAFPAQGLELQVMRRTETNPVLLRREASWRLIAENRG